MSSTHTSQTTSKYQSVFRRLWWVGLLMVLAAVIINTLISLVAKALFSVAPTFLPLQPEGFIPSTVIGVVGAIIVFALLVRWAKHPRRLFQRIAVTVLLISLLPDLLLPFVQLYPGTTFLEVGALLVMHVATAFLCLVPMMSQRSFKTLTCNMVENSRSSMFLSVQVRKIDMSQRTNQEPMRSLPTNYVIGVIDQLQEAEQAIQTLQNAGYAAQDMLLIPSQDFIEAIQQRRQQTSAFKRAIHAFSVSSDDGFPADLYLQQAQRGAHILAVYASTGEQAQQIVQELHASHVHHLKYFSKWTTTDYPPSAGS